MNKFYRRISFVAVVALLFGVFFSGCSGSKNQDDAKQATGTVAVKQTATEALKEVKLTYYAWGDQQTDFPDVLGELNNKLKKDINATLDVVFVSSAEWNKKIPLLLASGEQFDMLFTGAWALFQQEGNKGGFLALNDLLQKDAPQLMKTVPKAAWDQSSLNGKIYMVPWMQPQENFNGGLAIRADLRKKYGMPELKSMEDVGKFLENVAKNESGMIPFNISAFDSTDFIQNVLAQEKGYADNGVSNTLLYYNLYDPACKLVDLTEIPGFEERINLLSDWAQKGYWSKNYFANKVNSRDALKDGQSAVAAANLATANDLSKKAKAKHPDWEVEYVYFGQNPMNPPYNNGGVAINRNAKNPDRALMLIDRIYNDKDYNQLLRYGIKGKHYDVTQDGKLILPEGVTRDKLGYTSGNFSLTFSIANDQFKIASVEPESATFTHWMDIKKKSAVDAQLGGFFMNSDNIKSELATILNIKSETVSQIFGGAIAPADGIKKLKEQLQAASVDKVKAELQKQIDEYLKGK